MKTKLVSTGVPIRKVCTALILSCLILAAFVSAGAAANQPAPTLDGPEMRFVVVRAAAPRCDPICPEWISAEGDFAPGTPAKFEKFLKELGGRKLPIVIHSYGGQVRAAMAMAKMIRSRGLDVAVGRTVFLSCSPEQMDCEAEKQGGYTGTAVSISAVCHSACAIAIAGGVSRLVGQKASLGVHQVWAIQAEVKVSYRTSKRTVKGKEITVKEVVSRKKTGRVKKVDVTKSMRRELTRFYEEMGVSRDILLLVAKTPWSQMRVLFQSELLAMKVATESGGVEIWVDPEICEKAKVPTNCRRISSPLRLRIVTSRKSDCATDCAKWISMEGDIDETAVPKLQEALNKVASPVRLVLASRGDVESAIELGRFIRMRGLTVLVGRTDSSPCRPKLSVCTGWNSDELHVGTIDTEKREPYCSNVCIFAMAGGVERIVSRAVRVYIDRLTLLRERADAATQQTADLETRLAAYLQEMGVSPEILMLAPADPAADHFRLSVANLEEAKLSTTR